MGSTCADKSTIKLSWNCLLVKWLGFLFTEREVFNKKWKPGQKEDFRNKLKCSFCLFVSICTPSSFWCLSIELCWLKTTQRITFNSGHPKAWASRARQYCPRFLKLSLHPGEHRLDKNSMPWKHGGLLQMLLPANRGEKKQVIVFAMNALYVYESLNKTGHQVSPLKLVTHKVIQIKSKAHMDDTPTFLPLFPPALPGAFRALQEAEQPSHKHCFKSWLDPGPAKVMRAAGVCRAPPSSAGHGPANTQHACGTAPLAARRERWARPAPRWALGYLTALLPPPRNKQTEK